MFKKKPAIKTLSPLRSSDRRKIADRIIADYGLESNLQPASGSADVDGGEDKAAATAAHTVLRNSLLPDNSLSAKFTTTSGPELKAVHGTVYVGSHGKGEQRVLWVMLDDKLYPTVYTLWRNPGILPLLHTPSIVVQKLKGGADLMTPGLAGPPFPPKAKTGAVVAIASLDDPSVPVVVGTCAVDVSALQQVQGAKGHAVQTVHWAGDELWDWSTSGKPGAPPPESIEGWDVSEPDAGPSTDIQGLSIHDDEEEDGGVSLQDPDPPADVSKKRNGFVDGEDIFETIETADEGEMATSEIDQAFRRAFLYGIYHYKQNNPHQPKYGLVFPLSQSFVMSDLVLPFLPIFTPKQAESLTMKKTSFKTIRKFIKALDKEKLLLSKERPGKAGNDVLVWDIDFDDRAFADFVPYELPKKDTSAVQASGATAGNKDASVDESVGQKLRKIDLYRPKESLSPLFESARASTKSLYQASEIRSVLTTYIESENLLSATNKRLVTLDPVLSNVVLSTSNALDNELLAKGSIPRDALGDRVLAQCAPYHAILRNHEAAAGPADAAAMVKSRAKAGAAPRVEVVLETRSGNKTVTRVHGLEAYFVPAQPLADELRKSCASSTSVEQFKGGARGVMEVMVQGPQTDAVVKALEKRGVAKQWVQVVDKTKGKKK